MVIVGNLSKLSKKHNKREIPLTEKQYADGMRKFQEGAFIQDAFPTLSASDREFILTGITPEEWDFFFGEEEKE